ncbi:DUF4021 domain-containing protein [Heyndrickxia shackletonii]|nr:DUF4021 domain-containing protein [Heyndrickxia shackletonii]MBB2481794.1 DUF4021 domain-containing protein [Bacillus sp. APMAM]NEY98174.1 DUF4021 domain-containing protein [Heyndrickxia shackletonii]RTZ54857.1 DUF4021 domain-containing protein [Bacillus sp. SAJ1]
MKKQNSEVATNNENVNSYQSNPVNDVDIEDQAMNGLYGMVEPESEGQ